MPDVIVPEDQEVLLGGKVGSQLAVPLQVLSVPMTEEQQTLGKVYVVRQGRNYDCQLNCGQEIHFNVMFRIQSQRNNTCLIV